MCLYPLTARSLLGPISHKLNSLETPNYSTLPCSSIPIVFGQWVPTKCSEGAALVLPLGETDFHMSILLRRPHSKSGCRFELHLPLNLAKPLADPLPSRSNHLQHKNLYKQTASHIRTATFGWVGNQGNRQVLTSHGIYQCWAPKDVLSCCVPKLI